MVRENRIIPARAGFTWSSRRRRRRKWDHPRSRGVYEVWRRSQTVPKWIIPARAGFTRLRTKMREIMPDHPRSRGVYSDVPGVFPGDDGSSPLARGLHQERREHSRQLGIIPARAGFTGNIIVIEVLFQDHPRSRGVYRGRAPGKYPARWIIPARAGFTYYTRSGRPSEPDHPRSRGVYGLRGSEDHVG